MHTIDKSKYYSKNIKQYIADAFTDKIFHGNPAAVCIMEQWIPEQVMQNIANENNLSETAFIVKENNSYSLRWFTPGGEIDLCGHATLASAYVIMEFIKRGISYITFTTKSGKLLVVKKNDLYEMTFPAYKLTQLDVKPDIIEVLGAIPQEVYLGRDLLCILDNEQTIKDINPNMDKAKKLEGLLLHVTAKGNDVDCVSRSFAPKLNIPEDSVCGSGHCHIVPYWTSKLAKEKIVAYQASKRGGTLYCNVDNGKVKLSGKVVLFSIANIYL